MADRRSGWSLSMKLIHQQEALLCAQQQALMRNFKQQKQQDWKKWVERNLEETIAKANNAKGGSSKLYSQRR